jgi:ribosome biogenesis protein BMS1
VKKPVKDKGDFRATFGHKIQMSDLVILKAWVPVEIPTFYNPMIDLDIWPRMRSVNEIRRDTQTPIPHKADCSYGNSKQDRSKISNKFSKIRIPTKVMEQLPFKSKLKVLEKKSSKVKRSEKADIERGSGQIILPGSSEADQKQMSKIRSVIHGLNVVRKTRIEARKTKNSEKKALKEKREAFIVEKREEYKKEAKKRHFAITGAKEARDRKRMRLDGGKRKSAREALD